MRRVVPARGTPSLNMHKGRRLREAIHRASFTMSYRRVCLSPVALSGFSLFHCNGINSAYNTTSITRLTARLCGPIGFKSICAHEFRALFERTQIQIKCRLTTANLKEKVGSPGQTVFLFVLRNVMFLAKFRYCGLVHFLFFIFPLFTQ